LLQPDIIISHRMGLDGAATAYRMFDKKDDDYRKIVLTP
jgi:threonine dehydrogenase-like Zn-dependent dehydrogenase